MGRFDLTDDLLTGMPDTDGHHRVLFALANEVTDPAAAQELERAGTLPPDFEEQRAGP